MPAEAVARRNITREKEKRRLKRLIVLIQDVIAWRLKRRANTHSLKRLIILIQDKIAWRQAALYLAAAHPP